MSNTQNPVEAKVATLSTKMIVECLEIFQAKGYVNLNEEEDMVEGAMLQELLNRDEVEAADAHVEAM